MKEIRLINPIDLMRPRTGEIPNEISIQYFENTTKAINYSLTRMNLERTSLGALKIHALSYAFARALEAGAKYSVANGESAVYYSGESARWYKAFCEGGEERWEPYLEEVGIEVAKIRQDPDSTFDNLQLANALGIILSRLSIGI